LLRATTKTTVSPRNCCRDWLEQVRENEIKAGQKIDRPPKVDSAPKEAGVLHHKRIAELFDALTRDIPVDPEQRTQQQNALWLLAHILDWYRRETKVKWWSFFHLADLNEDDLYMERTAIAGMSYVTRLPKASPRERSVTDQYNFTPQECSIDEGEELYTQDRNEFGKIVSIDPLAGTVAIKKNLAVTNFHPTCVFEHTVFDTRHQAEGILKLAEWILKNGIDQPGEYRAARDLLLRNAPRLKSSKSIQDGELSMQSICEIGVALDQSMLPIQGPPGSGKTYTAANIICALVTAGKKVGVTANSHSVIRKLLDDVANIAKENQIVGVKCGHRNKTSSTSGSVLELANNNEVLNAFQTGAVNVVGATSFAWSRDVFKGALDVLVVDEAGQMALAAVLACSGATQNIILLGDPQQLEQPTQGSHPEGSDVSALGHVLGQCKTITSEQGIFLTKTRRLHPEVCKFTSEMFYEDRLSSHPGLENQRINAEGSLSGAGLWFALVEHSGNQSHSLEEINAVEEIVKYLTKPGQTWTKADGSTQPLSLDKILIVAPFNDQVNRLSQRLPNAHVGTVDRFQGQEGAVVIYSMTASSAEDAPRGMEFLYNLNRFNVATSRAKCSCIVVASPALFEPECRTPRQIELANALCRYAEMGRTV
jgi:AAA domain